MVELTMLIGDTEYLQPSTGYDWKCRRCGHQWCYRGPRVADPQPPAQCAGCRTAYWNRAKTGKSKRKAKPEVKSKPESHPLLSPPPYLRDKLEENGDES